jgi:glycosyltransferase involved in cell wall biosynthesis
MNELLYISASIYPSKSANSNQVVQQVNGLKSFYSRVALMFKYKGTEDHKAILFNRYLLDKSVELLGVRYENKLYILGYLIQLILAVNKFESVFTRNPLSLAIIALFSFGRGSRKVIYEAHSTVSFWNKFFIKIIMLRGIKFRILTISEELKGYYVSETSCKNVDFYHDGAELKPKKESVPGKSNIGYVGSFNKGRGLDIIVGLAKKYADIGFHLFGGTVEDLEKNTVQSIPENITCYGFIGRDKLDEAFNTFDIAIAPYEDKVFVPDGRDTSAYMSPLKIFEYMSYQKLLLVSNHKVLKSFLNDDNAYIVKQNDLSSWQKVIDDILSEDDDVLLSKVRRSYDLIEKKYNWKSRAEFIYNAYQ